MREVLAGFDQDERTFVDDHGRLGFAGHVDRLGLSRNGRLRRRNLVGIGIDPLQPTVLRDAMEVFQGEDVGRGGGDCHGAFGASQ